MIHVAGSLRRRMGRKKEKEREREREREIRSFLPGKLFP